MLREPLKGRTVSSLGRSNKADNKSAAQLQLCLRLGLSLNCAVNLLVILAFPTAFATKLDLTCDHYCSSSCLTISTSFGLHKHPNHCDDCQREVPLDTVCWALIPSPVPFSVHYPLFSKRKLYQLCRMQYRLPCLYSYKGIKHFDENFAAKTTSILNTVILLLSSNITVGHPVTNKSHPITDFWQESCICFHTLLAYFYLCEWSVLVSWFWLG